jgi:hypothetical protein
MVTPENARCLGEREEVLATSSGLGEEGLDDDDSDDDSFDGPEEQT